MPQEVGGEQGEDWLTIAWSIPQALLFLKVSHKHAHHRVLHSCGSCMSLLHSQTVYMCDLDKPLHTQSFSFHIWIKEVVGLVSVIPEWKHHAVTPEVWAAWHDSSQTMRSQALWSYLGVTAWCFHVEFYFLFFTFPLVLWPEKLLFMGTSIIPKG